MARFHDVDEDVPGVQVGHQIRLIRLADGLDGVAYGSVRLAGTIVEFVIEAQQSQHRISVDGLARAIASGEGGAQTLFLADEPATAAGPFGSADQW